MLFPISVLFALTFFNGFSDAPNSVSSSIASYSLTPRRAITLAAMLDLSGVLIFSFLNPSVAYTCSDIASIDPGNAETAVCAGMLASLLWAVAAWRLGIPTSESHAMAAAVSGAALLSGGEVSLSSWGRIFVGFLPFSLLAFFISPIVCSICASALKESERHARVRFLAQGQTLFCLLCAFMHGAQDGQKFIGMMMLFSGSNSPSLASVLLCALTLSLGTLTCSERIIKATAFEMVRLDAHRGFSADVTSFSLMLTASLCGIPVSTSNIKSSAMLGAQFFSDGKRPDMKKAAALIGVWLLTFPACFLLGGGIYLLMK